MLFSQSRCSSTDTRAKPLLWHHLRKDILSSCNLSCRLIFVHGRSQTYRVASLRAGPVGRISYNLYLIVLDCNLCGMSLVIFNKRINVFLLMTSPINICILPSSYFTQAIVISGVYFHRTYFIAPSTGLLILSIFFFFRMPLDPIRQPFIPHPYYIYRYYFIILSP